MLTVFTTCRATLRGWWYAITTLTEYALRRFAARHGFYEYTFRRKFGHPPDYAHPRTLNEKLAWMRLYDHNPRYTQLVDKVAMRDYVRARLGDDVLIPCYGVWERAEEIPFDALPARFVLKCNHESGFVVLCRDRAQLDARLVRAQLATRLRMNYSHRFLEWPYRDVPPRVLAEELLQDEEGGEPLDYKIHCLHGVPTYIYVVKNRHSHPICRYYAPDWTLLPFACHPAGASADCIPRPLQLPRMLEIAAALSRELHYGRVDLYAVRGKVSVGEITIISGAGLLTDIPPQLDRAWGDRLTLPTEGAQRGGAVEWWKEWSEPCI